MFPQRHEYRNPGLGPDLPRVVSLPCYILGNQNVTRPYHPLVPVPNLYLNRPGQREYGNLSRGVVPRVGPLWVKTLHHYPTMYNRPSILWPPTLQRLKLRLDILEVRTAIFSLVQSYNCQILLLIHIREAVLSYPSSPPHP